MPTTTYMPRTDSLAELLGLICGTLQDSGESLAALLHAGLGMGGEQ